MPRLDLGWGSSVRNYVELPATTPNSGRPNVESPATPRWRRRPPLRAGPGIDSMRLAALLRLGPDWRTTVLQAGPAGPARPAGQRAFQPAPDRALRRRTRPAPTSLSSGAPRAGSSAL